MSSTLTVKVEVEKKALPALGVRNIGYVQIVFELASEESRQEHESSTFATMRFSLRPFGVR